MIKALIIEDEKLAATKLEMMIKIIAPDITVVNKLASIEDSVSFLEDKPVIDLIFMDIHLEDGSCFRIFDKITVETPIIFTTAFDQYAIEAFKQNSIDYLLKPFDQVDLKQSIEKFKKYADSSPLPKEVDYNKLVEIFQSSKSISYQKRFMVYSGDRMLPVETNDISYFFAESKAVFLKTQNGRVYSVNHTLDKLDELLSPEYFFRANRKIIVNITSVKEVVNFSKSKLKLVLHPEPSFEVMVPAERISSFKKWMNS